MCTVSYLLYVDERFYITFLYVLAAKSSVRLYRLIKKALASFYDNLRLLFDALKQVDLLTTQDDKSSQDFPL